MLFSNKEIWVVLYLAVLVFLFRNLGWRRAMIGLLSIVLTIVCCDQLGNLSKDFFERLSSCRQCHGLCRDFSYGLQE